jgi:hypothetical protein
MIDAWDIRITPQIQGFEKDIEIAIPIESRYLQHNSLQAYQLINNQWLSQGFKVDTDRGVVCLKTSQLAPIMIGVIDEKNVYVYPNPATSQVTLKGFNPGAMVKIFTIAGELVNTLEDRDMDGVEIWGLRNDNGEDVASGVYMWTVVDKNGKVNKGKMGVIK